MESFEVRNRIAEAVCLDLVGPGQGSPLEREILRDPPSRWYLTGFLVPQDADADVRSDVAAEGEVVDGVEPPNGSDDSTTPEPESAKTSFFPSSMGLSVLVPREATYLRVTASWGDYEAAREDGGTRWQRHPKQGVVDVNLTGLGDKTEILVPGSDGLVLVVSRRNITGAAGWNHPGAASIAVFLVNRRVVRGDRGRDSAFAFQAKLSVHCETGFLPRPNFRGLESTELDERIADLQYRNTFEFAVGHGIATEAPAGQDGSCQEVWTTWCPTAEVEKVVPASIEGVTLGMEPLSQLANTAAVSVALGALPQRYREWIAQQRQVVPRDFHQRTEMGNELLNRAEAVAGRIEAGISLLERDARAFDAFRIANKVMARAARRRQGPFRGKNEDEAPAPTWRPFQLAFFLMNLVGIDDPTHVDRETVDLLFFPTGGGKTEAYLGLAAFTLIHRRFANQGISSAGVSVLMRYTLRLLTLDQLGRAATLICALELERAQDNRLGTWPFEIGLWVGKSGTPNRMGGRGDRDSDCAYRRWYAFQNDDRKPSPIPLEDCPWCGKKFKRTSFRLSPNQEDPTDLLVSCSDRDCEFGRGRQLPIVAIDEPLYRRLPCFVIATVDKFAAMPWTGQVGGLFGHVERADNQGFYGPMDPGMGRALDQPLLPPDLIIQDELHLISGPMGTIAGLYECALDELSSRKRGDRVIRPKVIASTATVRRAESQIRALFNRSIVEVFPSPGPNVRDSFFAKTRASNEEHARLYLGVAAQGRSPKLILLRAYLATLASAQKHYEAEGGRRNRANPADPYMTLLGYFNSLRELGGSRRIVEDEVITRLQSYAARKRVNENDGSFSDRRIRYEATELTSRISTGKVAEAKRKLSLPFWEEDRVDVALATNMISVGLDIPRLGLMAIFGQPKTSAEYIQATSRVGRESEKPGLVLTLLNVHKHRDRSHYERFGFYHSTFYRSVEATSVTPFSPRALDRALAAALVALARLGNPPMTAPRGAEQILQLRTRLDGAVDVLAARAASHALMGAQEAEQLKQKVRIRATDLLDEWFRIARDAADVASGLQYSREVGAAPRLLHEFLDPELEGLPRRFRKFRANRSMRDVEPSVNLWLRTLDQAEIEAEEGED